ncbi:40S ribosomal protein S3a [Plecturocebus cupreus]
MLSTNRSDKCRRRFGNHDSRDRIGKDTEKPCQSPYLLHHILDKKAKMLKKPNFELRILMEFHGEGREKLLRMRQLLKLNELIDMSH